MHIRAIAFDLDDTLLRDDRTISPYTVRVMREAAARGLAVIPASGRARDSMRAYVDQLGCASCYIACNGAEVWSPAHEERLRLLFPEETALEILAFGRERGVYTQTYDGTHFYHTVRNAYARDYAAASALTGVHTPDLDAFVRAHPTGKILMMDDSASIARMLTEARERFAGRASVTCSKAWFLEFNPPGATKGDALRWIGGRLGFGMDEVCAFGDSLNDMSMLEPAGMGVAVANARGDVRARLRYVCASNGEDGPAHFVEDIILKGGRP